MSETLESADSRFNRFWLQQRDDRKARGFDSMSPETDERKDREFVDPDTEVAAWTKVPAATALPAISGTAQVGQTLTTTNGTWTNSPTLSREWLRDGEVIDGATGTTYVLDAEDEDALISVKVTAEKTDYPDQYAVSATVGPVAAA